MDQPNQPFQSPSAPRLLLPRTHTRTPSRSPTRNRLSVTDDLFADFSPARILEAFTHPSGRLRTSIEAATQSERAFGIRAAIASKNIQEWVDELEEWAWPAEGGSLGFEIPVAKRRRLSGAGHPSQRGQNGGRDFEEPEYIGVLIAPKVIEYESRIEQINIEMDEMNVEEIKRQVLDTHFSPRSRPSSSASNAPPSLLSSYTRMDDFTAIVTATVLKALPNLSRLMRLMDVWSIRLNVLRKVPRLLRQLEEAEVALKCGWIAIQVPSHTHGDSNDREEGLSRQTFEIMQNVLQNKVTKLGQDLDCMLDTLEGREDTLPDAWLDRMEAIEHDYGEWAVAGDRKVREGEWAKMAKVRKEREEERRRQEEEVARLKTEKAQESETRRRREEKAARLNAEKEAQELEIERKEEEAARLKAEKEAQEAEAETARVRTQQEAQESEAKKLKIERETQQAEAARLETEREAEAEAARVEAERVAQMTEAARLKALQDAAHAETVKRKAEETEVARLKAKKKDEEAEAARLVAENNDKEAEAERLRAIQDAADTETSKQKAEEAKAARVKAENEAREAKQANAARWKEDQAAVNAEFVRRKAAQAREAEFGAAWQRAEREAEEIEATRERAVLVAQKAEAARLKAEQDVADVEFDRRQAEEEEVELVRQRAENEAREAEAARATAEKEAAEVARRKAETEALDAETRRLKLLAAAQEAETADRESQITETAAKEAEADRLKVLKDVQEAEAADLARRQAAEHAKAESARLVTEKLDEDQRLESSGLVNVREDETEVTKPSELDRSQDREVETEERDQPKHPSDDIVPVLRITALAGMANPAAFPAINSEISERQISQEVNENPSPRSSCECFDGGNDSRNEDSQSAPATLTSTRRAEHTNITSSESVQPRDANLSLKSLKPNLDNDGTARQQFSQAPDIPLDQTQQTTMSPEPDEIDVLEYSRDLTKVPSPASDRSIPAVSPPGGEVSDYDGDSTNPPAVSNLATSEKLDTRPNKFASSDHLSQIEPTQEEWIIDSPQSEVREESAAPEPVVVDLGHSEDLETKGHQKDPSISSGYSILDPTPEILEAEPAHYFRPIISSIKSARSSIVYSEPTTPKSPLNFSGMMTLGHVSPAIGMPETPTKSLKRSTPLNEIQSPPARVSPVVEDRSGDGPNVRSGDGAAESVPRDVELQDIRPPVLAHKASITRINTGAKRISISRRESVSSSSSTVVNGQLGDGHSSPIRPSTPPFDRGSMDAFREVDDLSPSIRRHRRGISHDYSSPDSPPPIPDLSSHRSIPRLRNTSISSTSTVDTPISSIETPFFDNVEVSPTPLSSPKKSNTDDQMQQQISSLLESIPARIRLTSEPDTNPPEKLVIKKTRPSVGPPFRSSSSMSTYSRAPTPSFTLAPAYGKGPSRQRPQNGNPEIKLYHLSRSTGEAPIKLFVRLVGEHGERVMVRVGGGWADLGEYLKEYASHHGRRAGVVDNDKVEIQDLPPRIVSTSSSTSTATLRGNGRSSPVSRPASAFDRPMSSLNIRKTRKSAGTGDLELPSQGNIFRSPSTPLPPSLSRNKQYETPPSVASSSTSASTSASGNGFDRSSSRMSWTEEESNLGLAGPKSKKVAISERDQEWVESMKEKVRLASAEKEKTKQRGTSFGEMDRVGGTKRLFRKS